MILLIRGGGDTQETLSWYQAAMYSGLKRL